MAKKKQLKNCLKTLMALTGLLNFYLLASKSTNKQHLVKSLKECVTKTNLLIIEVSQADKLDLGNPDCEVLIDGVIYRVNLHQEYCLKIILGALKVKGNK